MGNQKNFLLSLKSMCLLLEILFFFSIVTELWASSTTTVYVYPSTQTVAVGQTFTIDVKISDVSDLYGWEFKLTWNASLLDVVDVVEGPFLKKGGDTFFTKKMNNTEGYILVDCTLLGNVPGVDGKGTLATVEFYAEIQGESILDLYDTKLVNLLQQPITHTANDGNVTVSRPVGGIIILLDKFELLAPWIGLASTIIFAVAVTLVLVKYRKKSQ